MNASYLKLAPTLALLVPFATAMASPQVPGDQATPPVAAVQHTPAGQTTPVPVSQESLEQIPHTLKALEEAKAGEYGKLRTEDGQRLEAAHREIQSLRAADPDLRTLSQADRTRLFNAQEATMAIVSSMKRSQLVCTYRQNAGTRFRTKQCVTRDIAEAQRRAAKEATESLNRGCVPGEGNSCSR